MDGIFSIFGFFGWVLLIIGCTIVLGIFYLIFAWIKVGRDITKREQEKERETAKLN